MAAGDLLGLKHRHIVAAVVEIVGRGHTRCAAADDGNTLAGAGLLGGDILFLPALGLVIFHRKPLQVPDGQRHR